MEERVGKAFTIVSGGMTAIGCDRTVHSMIMFPMTSQSGGWQGAQSPRAPLGRRWRSGEVHNVLAADPKPLQLFGPPSADARGEAEKLLAKGPATGLLEILT
jgi:hypothetical protein